MKTSIIPYTLILIGVTLWGCSSNTVNNSDESLDFYEFKEGEPKTLPEGLSKRVEYINLKSQNPDLDFKYLTKALIKGDSIFLLDALMSNKLLLYDRQTGNAISAIGTRGNGPNEYARLCDFDVDSSGKIFVLDANLDKLFTYNIDLTIDRVISSPYDADALKVLHNGNILLGLSSWNKKKCSGDRVILVDHNLDYIKTLLKYDDSFDDSYWFSFYSFSTIGNTIQYNRPTDNSLYSFDLEGNLIDKLVIDFGDREAPKKIKQDIERNLDAINTQYSILVGSLISFSDYIFGTLRDRGKTRPFILDCNNKVCHYFKERWEGDLSMTLSFQDNLWISYLTPGDNNLDLNNYPQSVRENLANENFTLCIRTLNSDQ